MADLHAWATPAAVSGSPWDHTWVTDYDCSTQSLPTLSAVISAQKHCWLCWGSFHPVGGTPQNPDGSLGSHGALLTVAKCLVMPNVDSQSAVGARGTVLTYGLDGVCHQLANQVLYATGASPLTVKNARGYYVSSLLYGTYGPQRAAWAQKILGCTSPMASFDRSTDKLALAGHLPFQDQQDDLADRARIVLADEPKLFSKLLALRVEVQAYVSQPIPSFTPPSAEMLNARNQHLIDQAAHLLGRERFTAIFGFDPAERINLVDPEIMNAVK